MTTLRILFLGASRLVALLDRFRAAADAEGVDLELASIEDDSAWHAIGASGLARIQPGPRFDDPAFVPFLLSEAQGAAIDIVIPVVDAAIAPVAHARRDLEGIGAMAMVSGEELCARMRDKVASEEFFREHGFPVPSGNGWPRLAKPRLGSSSRGHIVLRDAEELSFWRERHPAEEYIVQPLLNGTEYSVDGFVSADGRVLGAVSRARVVVAAGEVMVTRTEHNGPVLEIASRVLNLPGWRGPINIQIMQSRDGPRLLEVNPRFSSGITCAIEAGLEAPRWILKERLGRPLPEKPIAWRSGLCMTRSRRDHFLWLS